MPSMSRRKKTPKDKFRGRRVYIRTWPHSTRGRVAFAGALAALMSGFFLLVDDVWLAAIMFPITLAFGLPLALTMPRMQFIELGAGGFRRTAISPRTRQLPSLTTGTDAPYDAIVGLETHRRTIVRVRYHSEPVIGSEPTHRVMLLDVDDRDRLIRDLSRRAKDVSHGATVDAVGENQIREAAVAGGRAAIPFALGLLGIAAIALIGRACG